MAIPTSGHTEGHVMYVVDDETLFTGDSLSWDLDRDDLWAEELVCWWSWADQFDSLERLTGHRFRRAVPTHGVIRPDLGSDEMWDRLSGLVASLRSRIDPRPG